MNGKGSENMEGLECRRSKIKVGTRANQLVLLDKTDVEWTVENFREDLNSDPVREHHLDVTIEKNAELPKLKWRVSLVPEPVANEGDDYKLALHWTLLDGYELLPPNTIFVQIGMQNLKEDGSLYSFSRRDYGPADLCNSFKSAKEKLHSLSIAVSGVGYSHGNSQKHLENLPLRSDGSLLFRITFQHFTKRFLTRFEKEVDPKTVECWLKQLEMKAQANRESVAGRNPDVQIICSDVKSVHFHKELLIARSPVFEAMFRSEMMESQSGVVKLEDLSGKDVNFIHDFIYDGRMLPYVEKVRDGEDLGELERWLYIISKYQLEDLIKFSDKLLVTLCNEGNAMDLLKLCNRFSLMGAREDVREFIHGHPEVLNNIV